MEYDIVNQIVKFICHMAIILTDYSGAILSLICTILYTRGSVLAWPFCIITNLINLYLFYMTGIFADAALEFVYLSMAFYGIWHWLYGGNNKKELQVSNTPVAEALILLLVLMIGYHLVEYILNTHTNSTVPKLDALAMMLSLVGQWLMCRKYIETWAIWFIADSVLAIMFYHKNLPAHFILNIIYLPITYYGYYNWSKLRSNYTNNVITNTTHSVSSI